MSGELDDGRESGDEFCFHCGEDLPAGTSGVCPHCGKSLDEDTDPDNASSPLSPGKVELTCGEEDDGDFCFHCGEDLPAGTSGFCPHCGKSLDEDADPESVPLPSPIDGVESDARGEGGADFCFHCGEDLPPGTHTTCPSCGKAL